MILHIPFHEICSTGSLDVHADSYIFKWLAKTGPAGPIVTAIPIPNSENHTVIMLCSNIINLQQQYNNHSCNLHTFYFSFITSTGYVQTCCSFDSLPCTLYTQPLVFCRNGAHSDLKVYTYSCDHNSTGIQNGYNQIPNWGCYQQYHLSKLVVRNITFNKHIHSSQSTLDTLIKAKPATVYQATVLVAVLISENNVWKEGRKILSN